MRPAQAHTSEDVSKQAMALGGQLMMRAAAGQQVRTCALPCGAAPPAVPVHALLIPSIWEPVTLRPTGCGG